MAAAGTTHRPQVDIVTVHGDDYVAEDPLRGKSVAVLTTIQGIDIISVILYCPG